MLKGKELEMYNSQEKQVKILHVDGSVIIGECVEFTSALDNEPEEASITLDSPLSDGKRCPWLMEIYKHEIKQLEILEEV